jgi:hypothetical protein
MSFFKKLIGGQKKPEIIEKPEIPEKVVQAPAPQDNKAVAEDTLMVSPEQILLNAQVETKDDVLELISQNLSSLGLVSGDYLEALLGREEKVSTYLINGVAIPHGVNKQKSR